MRGWIKAVLGVMAAGVASAGVLGAAMASGTHAAEAPQPRPTKSRYVIGLVAKSNENPVFLAARTGAQDAARKLGRDLGVEIVIDWQTPTSEDAQRQATAVERLASVADGIAVSASDANLLVSSINSAVERGVPVVTFDSDVPTSKRFAYFGTNDFECGRQVAGELVKVMGDAGVVAVLAGNQNAPNLQARVKGVLEGLKAHPGVKLKEVYYHAETAQDAVLKVEQVMAANPDITGWAMVGGWPLFTKNAMKSVAGKAKVVAVDALPAQLDYVRSGEVQTLLGQQVYEWGYQSVTLLMDKIVAGKEPAGGAIVNAPLTIVDSANVDEYGKNWERWLRRR